MPVGDVELPLTVETPPQPTPLLTYICTSFLLTVNIRESPGLLVHPKERWDKHR